MESDVFIRSMHPGSFRSGQWAKITGVSWFEPSVGERGRPCYQVQFIDGTDDLWPIFDSQAEYEFSSTLVESTIVRQKDYT